VPYLQIPSTGHAAAHAVVVQHDGRIVLTGVDHDASGLPVYRVVPGEADTNVAVLDETFGDGCGRAVVNGLHPYGTGLSLQPDGGILVVGMSPASGLGGGAVVRLTSAGCVDPGYGTATGAHVRVPGSASGFLTALQALPGGGLVVAGLASIADDDRPFVALLDELGGVDEVIGPDRGQLFSRRDTDVAAVAIQPDGRIVVAGTTKRTGGGYSGVLYRFPGSGMAEHHGTARTASPPVSSPPRSSPP
jgi:uncharacterized delta-60 repeat protein